MNSVNLVGRITRDPELRTSGNGRSFVAFTLAVSEYSGGKEYTQFVPCFVWEKTAENMAKYVKKGQQLAANGSINVRQTTNDGQTTTVVTISVQRVEFLGASSGGGAQTRSTNEKPSDYEFDKKVPDSDEIDVDNDAILFED